MLRQAIRLARPSSWIKNVLVLLPIVFAQRTTEAHAWLQVGLAAIAFCLASSAIYIFNDIHDREKDRQHPRTRDRPLAAGLITVRAAAIEGVVLLAAGLAVGVAANVMVLLLLATYVALQAAYTLFLKHRALIDVICIALGFVLRAAAGAAAIPVAISPWLFVCTFTLCLFLGFCKRCNEIATMGGIDDAKAHRPTLIHYTSELLTHLITVSAGMAILAFLLYATDDRTIKHFGTNFMVYTLPLQVYAVFRFAMLSMQGRYADPTDLILHDRPFQATVALWFAGVLAIIRWGPALHELAMRTLMQR